MKSRNFVQKWLKRFCKSTVEVDRKKREKRGYTKHKKSEISLTNDLFSFILPDNRITMCNSHADFKCKFNYKWSI